MSYFFFFLYIHLFNTYIKWVIRKVNKNPTRCGILINAGSRVDYQKIGAKPERKRKKKIIYNDCKSYYVYEIGVADLNARVFIGVHEKREAGCVRC